MSRRLSSLKVSNLSELTLFVIAGGSLPPNSFKILNEFEKKGDKEQREYLENAASATDLLRVLFSIVANIKGDREMTYHALALINGIIEDRRTRIKYLVTIQKAANREKQMDIIGILNSFLNQSHEMDQANHRDLAAHTQAMLIEAFEYTKCAVAANNFMNYLLD